MTGPRPVDEPPVDDAVPVADDQAVTRAVWRLHRGHLSGHGRVMLAELVTELHRRAAGGELPTSVLAVHAAVLRALGGDYSGPWSPPTVLVQLNWTGLRHRLLAWVAAGHRAQAVPADEYRPGQVSHTVLELSALARPELLRYEPSQWREALTAAGVAVLADWTARYGDPLGAAALEQPCACEPVGCERRGIATGRLLAAIADVDDAPADDEPEPFVGPGGPVPGFVAGRCGHRVAESEWRAGFRVCERCPAPADESGDGP